jgi:protein-S-isoprenylcysteine O-methyltransferase Ste14
MLPSRSRRLRAESAVVRFVATLGIVGIGVALGAILVSSKVEGWIVGLVVSLVTVVLAGVLWSTRKL